MLNLLESRAIRLAVGPTHPLEAAESNAPDGSAIVPDKEMEPVLPELEKYEALGESAYDAMYQARSFVAKDCFDDARGYFFKAIEAAKRAGLNGEVARLTRRLEHIVSVYDHQVRGVGR